jgi:hypothetical protein
MSGFSTLNVERSTRLHALMKELVDKAGADVPPLQGFVLSRDEKQFSKVLARSRLFDNCDTTFQQARMFALGVTQGLGGDKFQRFLGANAAWSHLVHGLKTHAPKAATINEIRALWSERFGIDFTSALLPVHSTLDGRVLLLFSWLEDDLMPTSSKATKVYMACLMRLKSGDDDALKSIRAALTVTSPGVQSAFCELLPRSWLLHEGPPKGTRFADDMALAFDDVAAFGRAALLHFETYAIIDGECFAAIEAEVADIQKQAEKAKKKRARKARQ